MTVRLFHRSACLLSPSGRHFAFNLSLDREGKVRATLRSSPRSDTTDNVSLRQRLAATVEAFAANANRRDLGLA